MMKKINYSICVLLVTLIFTFWVTTYGKIEEDTNISYTSSSNDVTVDDVCVDTFIQTYATQILKTSNYAITTAHRENVRSMLASMGNVNIMKLKNAVYSGSKKDIINGVTNFVDSNFLSEEKSLMKQYLSE